MDKENKSKPLSLIQRMKLKAAAQKHYGGDYVASEANVDARICPNCGASRAKGDGLTACAYCGFKFTDVTLSDGINIKKEDNSKEI